MEVQQTPSSRTKLPTLHYSNLAPAIAGNPIYDEWNLYCQEVERWLAEGHEGRHVLISGKNILGIFDTRDQAEAERLRRTLTSKSLIKMIRENESYVRVRGMCLIWPTRHFG